MPRGRLAALAVALGALSAAVVRVAGSVNEMPVPTTLPEECAAALRNRPVVVVTSLNGPFARDAKNRAWEKTLWEHFVEQAGDGGDGDGDAQLALPLVVYHENSWDEAHGRKPLERADLPFATCFLDVFAEQPGLDAYLRSEEKTPLDRLYEIPHSKSLSDDFKDGKVLIRKVAAIHHLAQNLQDGQVLLWLDLDVSTSAFSQGLPSFVEKWMQKKDVTYIAESVCWKHASLLGDRLSSPWQLALLVPGCDADFRVDSGVFSLRISKATKAFTADALAQYYGPMTRRARHCARRRGRCPREVRHNLGLNDIYVFATVLHSFGESLSNGWLTRNSFPGCRPQGPMALSNASFVGWGLCSPCAVPEPARAALGEEGWGEGLVAPFDMDAYLFHIKGGSAMMSRTHSAQKRDQQGREIDDRFKARDAELDLPHNWATPDNDGHVDPRRACMDPATPAESEYRAPPLPRELP